VFKSRHGQIKPIYLYAIVIIVIIIAIGTAAYYTVFYKPPPPPKEVIKIGVSFGLSGAYAAPSQRQLWGVLMWVEEINEQGGIYVKEYGRKLKVQLIYYDDRSDPATAVKLYERLITEDKVDILLGPYASGITFAVAPVAEKYKKVMISQMAAADKIPAQGYKYVFTTLPVTSQFALSRVELLNYLKKEKGYDIKTFALITSSELYPLSVARPTKTLLEKEGYKCVLYEEYPKGLTDFSAILLKAKEANPDFLYFVCYPADAYIIMRQLKGIGFKPKLIMFDDGPNDPKFVETFGDVAEGVLTQMSWHWELPFEGVKEFTEKFKARYGEYPRHWSAFPYAACQVIKAAIEKAGTLDNEKIRETLLTMKNIPTIVGPVTYGDWTNPMGQKLYQINLNGRNLVLQIQKGQMRIVIPRKYSTVEIMFPWPGWGE